MAGGTLDPYTTIGGIISVLQANLPAKFDALDTEYGDAITLGNNDIVARNYYWEDHGRYSEYPALVVKLTTDPTGEFGAGFNIREFGIQIHLLITGNEKLTGTFYGVTGVTLWPEEVLMIRLSRMLRGITEVLRDNPQMPISGSPTAEEVQINTIAFFDFEVSVANLMGKAGVLSLTGFPNPK